MPGRQTPGPVKLFCEQDACEPVRQSQPGQRPKMVGAPHAIFGYTVGSTDDEREVTTVGLPVIQPNCKLLAGKLLAMFIEDNDAFRPFNFRKDFLTFRCLRNLGSGFLRTRRCRNEIQAKPPLPRQSLHIIFERGVNPERLPITDRYQANMHESGH